MKCTSFIRTTVLSLNEALFCNLRDALVDNYLPLAIAKKEDLSAPLLAEKLCDYFESEGLRTKKSFDKIIEKYTSDLDSVVKDRIAKMPKSKKGGPAPTVPRARKYYDRSCQLREKANATTEDLLDYSRIVLCLYEAVIKNQRSVIQDFDLSMDKLNLPEITNELCDEESNRSNARVVDRFFNTVYKRFNPECADRSTFILLVIMFYYMKSKEIVGEY